MTGLGWHQRARANHIDLRRPVRDFLPLFATLFVTLIAGGMPPTATRRR